MLSSTAVLYNLPGVPNNIKLTGQNVSPNIYLGKITTWNDPAITKN